MHFVFICGEYVPKSSAVGNVCYELAKELSKKHKVTVICVTFDDNGNEIEFYEGHNIRRVKLTLDNKDIVKQYKDNKNIINTIKYFMYKVDNKFRKSFYNSDVYKERIDPFYTCLEGLNEKIDVIVPMSHPMSGVIASLRYKKHHKNVLVVPYLMDPFAESPYFLLKRSMYNDFRLFFHKRMEKKIIKNSHKVLAVPQMYKNLKKYNIFEDRIVEAEHPLVRDINKTIGYSDYKDSSRLTVTYAGAFIDRIRSPKYLLDIFKVFNQKNYNISLKLFSRGYEELIDEYVDNYNNIYSYGYIEKSLVDKELLLSDVLIIISNSDPKQSSSKIFDYLSFGKPIVLFYSSDDDVHVEILKKYPLKLLIKQDSNSVDNLAEIFMEFCENNKGKNIEYKEIESLYYYATPRYIANLLEKSV